MIDARREIRFYDFLSLTLIIAHLIKESDKVRMAYWASANLHLQHVMKRLLHSSSY